LTDQLIVSFVIPTLNEARYLAGALHSIENLKPPVEGFSMELIVVDSGSTDSTLAIARDAHARIERISPGPVGRSRNRGAEIAKGQYIAFVDADCELDPDWLVFLMDHFNDTNVVAAGTVTIPPANDLTWVERVWHGVGTPNNEGPSKAVSWLPTSNLLVRESVFMDIHGFNENLISCEDADLGYRLSSRGKLILENRIATTHRRESKTILQFFKREMWRGAGNLRSVLCHSLRMSEMPSILGPMLFLCMLALSLILFIMGFRNPQYYSMFFSLLVFALILPIGVLVRKRSPRWNLISMVQIYFLSLIYLSARGLGCFVTAKRQDG
jgi:glycosyltransferase involved in cell wall biosynthesis